MYIIWKDSQSITNIDPLLSYKILQQLLLQKIFSVYKADSFPESIKSSTTNFGKLLII